MFYPSLTCDKIPYNFCIPTVVGIEMYTDGILCCKMGFLKKISSRPIAGRMLSFSLEVVAIGWTLL